MFECSSMIIESKSQMSQKRIATYPWSSWKSLPCSWIDVKMNFGRSIESTSLIFFVSSWIYVSNYFIYIKMKRN